MKGNESSSGEVRLFIALPVASAVKDKLCHAQAELQARLRSDGVRWTKSDQIHLTIKFLGNVAGSQIEGLIKATTEACAPFAPFKLHAEGFGFFPENRLPRIIWAGVRDDRQELEKFGQAVSDAVAPFGAGDAGKSFAAHLTLGRIRHMRTSEVRDLVEMVKGFGDRVFGGWTADKVEIIRSESGAQGMHYTSLAEIALFGSK